jgi:hypothetical protein
MFFMLFFAVYGLCLFNFEFDVGLNVVGLFLRPYTVAYTLLNLYARVYMLSCHWWYGVVVDGSIATARRTD